MTKHNTDDWLLEILKRVRDIKLLATAEYDFRYGDGSGNTEYEMAKLKEIVDEGMKSAEQQIRQALLERLEAKAEEYPLVTYDFGTAQVVAEEKAIPLADVIKVIKG